MRKPNWNLTGTIKRLPSFLILMDCKNSIFGSDSTWVSVPKHQNNWPPPGYFRFSNYLQNAFRKKNFLNVRFIWYRLFLVNFIKTRRSLRNGMFLFQKNHFREILPFCLHSTSKLLPFLNIWNFCFHCFSSKPNLFPYKGTCFKTCFERHFGSFVFHSKLSSSW